MFSFVDNKTKILEASHVLLNKDVMHDNIRHFS